MNIINTTTMFMLIKFISMQHNSKLLFKLANSILGRNKHRHTLTLLMMTYLFI